MYDYSVSNNEVLIRYFKSSFAVYKHYALALLNYINYNSINCHYDYCNYKSATMTTGTVTSVTMTTITVITVIIVTVSIISAIMATVTETGLVRELG